MAKAIRDLGVKSDIDVIPLGEDRAAAAGAPDVDNPADRVATFQVEVRERVPEPNPTETPSPADAELPTFVVPRTKAEDVSESIDEELKDFKFGSDPLKMAWEATKMQWLAGASGYAGAQADVASRESANGVAIGVLYGAEGRTGKQLQDDFWQWEPGKNAVDQNIAKAGQNAFNNGLSAGLLQGYGLSPGQRESLWRELGPELGDRGDRSSWSTDDWEAAALAFRQLRLKEHGE